MRKACVLALLLFFSPALAKAQDGPRQSFLIIVLDGLRPDYVTADTMPTLHRLGEQGVVFEDHHAVFPTVTRVNSPSITTGTYPGTHGLMGNTVYFPEVDSEKGLSTSDANNLLRIHTATGETLLTATSLGEVLDTEGLGILALSSGSTGSALLLNHRQKGGGVINTTGIFPREQADQVYSIIGRPPPDTIPARARNAWVVDAYIKIGLERLKPAVTLMWLTDPDHTAHEAGVGSPKTRDALWSVDGEIRRIVDAHKARGLSDSVNVIVTADHGFSTHRGGMNIRGLLREHGLDEDVVVVGGAIYLTGNDSERAKRRKVERIVDALQKTDWAGAIFTSASDPHADVGWVAGTLSFDAIRWNHERSGDVLVSAAWTDEKNEYGFAGTTTLPGVAGHGSSSPYDIHATLIAWGPSFKDAARSAVPTSNTDIAPTVLHLLGVQAPDTMYGRVIREGLRERPDSAQVKVDTREVIAETEGYRVVMNESVVDGRRYLNYTRTER